MIRVFVEGVGLIGPGLPDWSSAQAILRAPSGYAPAPVSKPNADLLPPVERRRTSLHIRLALAAGQEALRHAGRSGAQCASVFSASGGSGDVIHQICEILTQEERLVSPTQFHNSVHNAPAGYWSIGSQSMLRSTSLCMFDASFAGGLLEAASQACASDTPVLYVSHDAPYPEPIHSVRPIGASFGVALVLSRGLSERAFASLSVHVAGAEPGAAAIASTRMANGQLDALRLDNPAARSLPLLEVLARLQDSKSARVQDSNSAPVQNARVTLEYLPGSALIADVTPALECCRLNTQ